MEEHTASKHTYYRVSAILMVLLLITAGVAYMNLGPQPHRPRHQPPARRRYPLSSRLHHSRRTMAPFAPPFRRASVIQLSCRC
jgi:hypothetical protein